MLGGCASVPAPAGSGSPRHAETCTASVFDEGSRLADGSHWSRARSRSEILVAHKSAPLGSRVRITNQRNGSTVVAPVRDRGPFVRGRCVDLSIAAARSLGIDGVAPVTVEHLRDQMTIK